jgi:hypothetical protein
VDVTVAVFPIRVSTPIRTRRCRYLSFQKASSPRKIGMHAAKPMRFHGDGSSRRRTNPTMRNNATRAYCASVGARDSCASRRGGPASGARRMTGEAPACDVSDADSACRAAASRRSRGGWRPLPADGASRPGKPAARPRSPRDASSVPPRRTATLRPPLGRR